MSIFTTYSVALFFQRILTWGRSVTGPSPLSKEVRRSVGAATARRRRGISLVEHVIVVGCIALLGMAGWTRYGRALRGDLVANAAHIEGQGLPNSSQLLGDLVAGYAPADPGELPLAPLAPNSSEGPAPKPGGDPNAPKCETGQSVGDDGLTREQRAHFRERIDNAESDAAADQVRYDRHVCKAANSGRPPLTPEAWQRANQRLRENSDRGSHEEKASLDALGVPNNNDGSPESFATPDGKRTRPDGVTEAAVIDVKSLPDDPDADGGPRVLYDSDQLRGQRDAARDADKTHVVIITNSNASNVRPSGPLAEKSVVLHRDAATGQFSKWNPQTSSWQSIPLETARDLVGTGDS